MRILLAAGLAAMALGAHTPAIGHAVTAPARAITVDEARTYQTMIGFGASLTDTSAWLISRRMTEQQRADLLADLFDPARGIGLTYLRQPMGSSDFRTREYTYDDVPDGQADPELKAFTVAPDDEYIVPLLRRIRAIAPSLGFMASPWSAPAWMKTNARLSCGRLRSDPAVWSAYAAYFVRFLEAYRSRGIPVAAVTLQNEPMNELWGYPTMAMSPADQARLAALLGPRLKAAGLTTSIVIWDHNWDHPEFPLQVLGDAAARPWIEGVAWHGYAGDVSAQSRVRDAYPDKSVYFTEVSGGTWATDFGQNLMWDLRNLLIGATRNWARVVLKWNLALDENNGPKLPGGAGNCRGVVTIDSRTGTVRREEEYYALGHLSRFVRPGARRVHTDDPLSVAFQNTDGTLALVVCNPEREAARVSVAHGSRRFAIEAPPVGVVTCTWSPTSSAARAWVTAGDRSRLLDRAGDAPIRSVTAR